MYKTNGLKRWCIALVTLTFLMSIPFLSNFAFAAPSPSNDSQDAYQPQAVFSIPEDNATIAKNNEYNKDLENIQNLYIEKHNPVDPTLLNAVKSFGEKWGKGTSVSAPMVSNVSPQIVYSKVLGVNAVSQNNLYYCGPASAVQLLLYLGITKNRTDGRTTDQPTLAAALRTDPTNGTGFTGYWQQTLNSWTAGSPYYTATYAGKTGLNTLNDMWTNLYTDVNNGRPVIFDTHMTTTPGYYLVGYGDKARDHYVTGDGWQEDDMGNEQVHYVDPNNFRSGCFGPHWVPAQTMWNCINYPNARGMVY